MGKGREKEVRVSDKEGRRGSGGRGGSGGGKGRGVGCGLWYVDGREDGRWVGCGKAGKAVNVDFCMCLWVSMRLSVVTVGASL